MTVYTKLQNQLRSSQNTWLVTGAAGFVGSNLVEKLLTLNQKVVGLDNFETGYQHNLDQAVRDALQQTSSTIVRSENGSIKIEHENFRFIEGDIRNLVDCQTACDGVDYVLHQAALGSISRSIEDPVRTNKANIDGFLNMLVSARDACVKRLVYATSSSTYGDSAILPKIEAETGKPLNPYAVTKIVNELYASVFSKTYGFDSIGLRYFNIFGKRQNPDGDYAAVIPKWITSIHKGDPVFINGDGNTSRDFCFIENAIQMNLLAATANSADASNQVYNVAVGGRTTLRDLYELITSHPELSEANLCYRDFRIGDMHHSQADISKAEKLLGYRPSHTLEQGLREAIPWYLEAFASKCC